MAVVDDFTHALNTFNGAIDIVLKEPRGPKRWRAANTLWLSLSSKHRRIYKEVCADNRATRESVSELGFSKQAQKKINRYGYSSDHTMRECLNIPAGAYMWIAKADPDAFVLKSNAAKMFNTFPEYRTRSVL